MSHTKRMTKVEKMTAAGIMAATILTTVGACGLYERQKEQLPKNAPAEQVAEQAKPANGPYIISGMPVGFSQATVMSAHNTYTGNFAIVVKPGMDKAFGQKGEVLAVGYCGDRASYKSSCTRLDALVQAEMIKANGKVELTVYQTQSDAVSVLKANVGGHTLDYSAYHVR